MRRVLSRVDGKPITLGEAHRLAQNDIMMGAVVQGEKDNSENHLQFSLLGDPALSLNLPQMKVVVDSINGVDCRQTDAVAKLKAGSIARIAGHIEGAEDYQGVVTATVRDSRNQITCKLNDTSDDGASEAFRFYDRQKTLFNGSDSVRNGQFVLSFAVPKDINYSDSAGLVNLFAITGSKNLPVQGSSDRFLVGGSEEMQNDSIGLHLLLSQFTFFHGWRKGECHSLFRGTDYG